MFQPFKVANKQSGATQCVYAVKMDKNGYPRFLVYIDSRNSWVWVKAKHFVPVKGDMS